MERAGTRFDEAWQRLMQRAGARRAWDWGAPGAVLVTAALTRLAGLGHPHELVFDETYYVKDAYTLSQLGYEAAWPQDPNPAFEAGDVNTYLTSPSFVAHPPIGKWMIAGGMALLGADDPVGWRISVAIAGVLLVLVTMLLAKRLFRSTLLAATAGGMLAIDGNAIVMSRVALLDTMLALFALAGTGAVLLDAAGNRRRTADWLAWRSGVPVPTAWGPVFWNRPWLLAAGVLFGLAAGVKWSGLYFLAVFGLYAVGSEVLLRRRLGIRHWLAGTLLRQGPATFLLMVPVALVVYLASWTGWFVTDGGYYRHWIERDGGQPWTGALAWVPYDLQNWWHYQASMYGYHVSENSPHSYAANPLGWLFLVRPTSMYWHANGNNAETILGVANPLIWWAGAAALGFVAFRLGRRLVRAAVAYARGDAVWFPESSPRRAAVASRDAFILAGIAAGYLPWLLYLNRTVFNFYTIAFEPYLILALTSAIAVLLGRPADPESRRAGALAGMGALLVVCILLSVFFLPVWTGMEIPRWYMNLHFWFPSWI